MAEYYAESHVIVEKFKYTWVVRNFNRYYGKPGSYLNSANFCARMDDKDLEWFLTVYPNGIDSDGKFVGVTITTRPTLASTFNAHFIVNFTLSTSEIRIGSDSTMNFSPSQQRQSFNKFAERETVLTNFLLNGDLTIKVELYIRKDVTNDEPVLKVEENIKFNSNDLRLSGLRDFEQLFKSTMLSDINIMIKDQKIPAHKNILAARSSVFQAMFIHETQEKKKNVVSISDTDYEVMMELLRFMYCGKVNNIEEIAIDLLVAADKYDVKDLRVLCEEVILGGLSLENVSDLLVFIDTYSNATKLRAAAFEFIASHLKDLQASQQFHKTLEQLSPLFAELIRVIESKV